MDRFPKQERTTESLASSIESKREYLERENFVQVDMSLSVPERGSLERIRIERDLKSFNAYGPISDDLKTQLAQHLSNAGQNDPDDIDRACAVIHRLASGMQNGFDKEAAWVTVRVSTPNSTFDIPRWHSDGAYFDTTEKTYKLVATLKGASTLFGRVVDEAAYRQLEEAEVDNQRRNRNDPAALAAEDLRIRRELAKVIEPMDAQSSEQATIYLVGGDNAMIHSEPAVEEPRIFVSVLPGSREQIEEWRTRSK